MGIQSSPSHTSAYQPTPTGVPALGPLLTRAGDGGARQAQGGSCPTVAMRNSPVAELPFNLIESVVHIYELGRILTDSDNEPSESERSRHPWVGCRSSHTGRSARHGRCRGHRTACAILR